MCNFKYKKSIISFCGFFDQKYYNVVIIACTNCLCCSRHGRPRHVRSHPCKPCPAPICSDESTRPTRTTLHYSEESNATGLEDDRTRFLLLTLRSRLYREATAVFAKCAACPLLRARRNIQAFEPTSPGPEFLKTFTSRRLFKKLGGKAPCLMSFYVRRERTCTSVQQGQSTDTTDVIIEAKHVRFTGLCCRWRRSCCSSIRVARYAW